MEFPWDTGFDARNEAGLWECNKEGVLVEGMVWERTENRVEGKKEEEVEVENTVE